ncbi:MAG: choice-of-anchor J domain-containing protein [Bacteroidales bacterium]|nr:choice-of-anchor J domain-containing protein [Bacteroidales bacterium]
MKKSILSLMLFALLGFNALRAQVNIGGEPVSYGYEKRDILVENDILVGNEEELAPVVFVRTPPLDMAVVETEDEQWEAERAAGMTKIGRRFGIEFEVEYDVHNSGTWSCLPDGGKLWRLGVECPEALSINLIFDRYFLPAGATLYIYGEDRHDKIGGFTNYNNQADNFFATDVVLSDKIVIEYYQPVEADFDGELRLATIVHGYRGPGEFTRGYGQSGSCQRNTICPEGNGWQDQVRSVFALYSGGTELCSGSIVNNTANDKTPYALTANHCWNAAQNPGIWVFRFRWESPTCTPTANSTYKTMTGATLRMKTPTNTSSTDCCLVELYQTIPDDYDIYYAGWSRSTTPSSSAMCIHHPSLDIKKISPTNPLYTSNTYVQAWRANWSTNACTEGGSSGSPLFDSNHRVIGQLYGGLSSCATYGGSNHWDEYGRFDLSWNYGSSSATRLRDWLDPLNLNPTTWDGYDPNAGPAICNPPTNLTVDYTPECNAELNWQPPAGKSDDKGNFLEDVEAHPNFAINSTLNGWSYIDGDGKGTYGMTGYEFPNSGSPMAFIVFNPSATTPPNTTPAATPHSGQKFFASICPLEGVNNDWIISPLLTNPTTFSFWAKTYTSAYNGLERMKVGYSTTGTAQGNFTFLTPSPYVEVPTAWTKYEYSLPAGTKYVAINCVSDDAFILMIDDLQLTGVSNPGGKIYNVYRDNVLIKANLAETSYTDSGFPTGTGHTWSVKQVCTDGESDPVSVTKTACTQVQTWTITPSAGANGTIAPSTPVTVNHGGSQTFTFTPAPNYEVDQVKVDNVNVSFSNNQYTFTNVTTDHTINVTFKLKTYTLTPTAGANGAINPNTPVTVNHGASQTFTFSPASGYEVDEVKVDGATVSFSNNNYTFTNVTADHTINVTFKTTPIEQHTITATAGANGGINPSGTVIVNHGANQPFFFLPDNGYEVNEVTVDGTVVNVADDQYTFTNVTADHTIHVTFKTLPPVQYTITATAGANGIINPSGVVTVNHGDNQTFFFIPDSGYQPDEVTVDGAPVSFTENQYTFTNITSDHTINVTFKQLPPDQYTITVIPNDLAWGSVSGGGVYPAGATADVIATPATNYNFVKWTEDGAEVSITSLYSFIVEKDRYLTAWFEPITAIGEPDAKAPQLYYFNDVIYFKNIPPETTVQIFDVCGRAIQQTTLTGESIPFYYKGFYVVKLIHSDKTVITEKIVAY